MELLHNEFRPDAYYLTDVEHIGIFAPQGGDYADNLKMIIKVTATMLGQEVVQVKS